MYDILTFLFKDRNHVLPNLPDHKFFKDKNWLQIGNIGSSYITVTLSE